MLSAIQMMILALAGLISDLLPLEIVLDSENNISISIRGIIIFIFIIVLLYEFIKIFSSRRHK